MNVNRGGFLIPAILVLSCLFSILNGCKRNNTLLNDAKVLMGSVEFENRVDLLETSIAQLRDFDNSQGPSTKVNYLPREILGSLKDSSRESEIALAGFFAKKSMIKAALDTAGLNSEQIAKLQAMDAKTDENIAIVKEKLVIINDAIAVKCAEYYKILESDLDLDIKKYSKIILDGNIDLKYHGCYSKERMKLQWAIIQQNLREGKCEQDKTYGSPISDEGGVGQASEFFNDPKVLFTGGGMGSGKGYVLEILKNTCGLLQKHITIDPDALKEQLPEFAEQKEKRKNNPNFLIADNAARFVHVESGFIQEILQKIAENRKCNMVIDGSLRDFAWNFSQMKKLKERGYKISILHVSVTEDVLIQRVQERGLKTGRKIDLEEAKSSLRQVNCSMAKYMERYADDDSRLVDFYIQIDNSSASPAISVYRKDHNTVLREAKDGKRQLEACPATLKKVVHGESKEHKK